MSLTKTILKANKGMTIVLCLKEAHNSNEKRCKGDTWKQPVEIILGCMNRDNCFLSTKHKGSAI